MRYRLVMTAKDLAAAAQKVREAKEGKLSDDRPAVMAGSTKAAKAEVPTADHEPTSGEPRLAAATFRCGRDQEHAVTVTAALCVVCLAERVASLEAFLGLEPGATEDPVAAAALRFRVDAREQTARLRQEGRG